MGKEVSPSLSFEGWRFNKWFLGNWSTIKEFIKVGVPLLTSLAVTQSPVWVGFFTIVGKFVIDSGEYWFKQYTK